jgi:hypothetical protein
VPGRAFDLIVRTADRPASVTHEGRSSSLCHVAVFAKLRHIMYETAGHGSPGQYAILYRIAY